MSTTTDPPLTFEAKCFCTATHFTITLPPSAPLSLSTHLCHCSFCRWYTGTLAVCVDCRLQTGAHVQPWVSVPASTISPSIGSPSGTLRTFASSAKVARAFCGNCGATVFARRKRKPSNGRSASSDDEILSLAVGVLRAPEGPLAEEWLQWHEEVAFEPSGRREV